MGQDRLQSKGSEKLTEGRAFAGTMCWESREKAKDGGHPGAMGGHGPQDPEDPQCFSQAADGNAGWV